MGHVNLIISPLQKLVPVVAARAKVADVGVALGPLLLIQGGFPPKHRLDGPVPKLHAAHTIEHVVEARKTQAHVLPPIQPHGCAKHMLTASLEVILFLCR